MKSGAMSRDFIRRAVTMHGATEQDVINGIKSYVVARKILSASRRDGDHHGLPGGAGRDQGQPALHRLGEDERLRHSGGLRGRPGRRVTHALVQYLFDRPGFQQDPVAETAARAA